MGHELWTSPVTGYRRRGTRLADLQSLVSAGITASAVLEPLKSCLSRANALQIRDVLTNLDFDIAGVQDDPEGPIVGYVERQSLESGLVGEYIESISPPDLVSDSTPLGVLLAGFETRDWVFVLVGREVQAIITKADLNKPPARLYLFGLISLLEMHLGYWARQVYPGDEWIKELSPGRLISARKLLRNRRRRNHQIGLFECLQFCDKCDLVLASKEVRSSLGLGGLRNSRRALRRAEDLRNRLAHSQDDLAQGVSWPALIALVNWIEELTHTSDRVIEDRARRAARGDENDLRGST